MPFVDPSGEYTLTEEIVALASLSILTTIAVQNYLPQLRTSTKRYDHDNIVYRGLRSNENRFLIRLIGISSKGHYPYTPSQHIERTRKDTAWISTSRKFEVASKVFASKWVAVINLDKVPKSRIFDTTVPWNFTTLSPIAKEIATFEKEVSIWLYINPFAIVDMVPK